MRNPHRSISGLTVLASVATLTFAWSSPVLGAAAGSAASERLTGNHISRLVISLLFTQSTDWRLASLHVAVQHTLRPVYWDLYVRNSATDIVLWLSSGAFLNEICTQARRVPGDCWVSNGSHCIVLHLHFKIFPRRRGLPLPEKDPHSHVLPPRCLRYITGLPQTRLCPPLSSEQNVGGLKFVAFCTRRNSWHQLCKILQLLHYNMYPTTTITVGSSQRLNILITAGRFLSLQ